MTDGAAIRPAGRRQVGERAWLLEAPDPAAAMLLRELIRSDPPAGLVDLVSGARTVLAVFDSPVAAQRAELPDAPEAQGRIDPGDREPVVVETVYDGGDLDHVAEAAGLGRDELIRLHADIVWVAAFVGFAPGFAYLLPSGVPRLPTIARRSTPRTEVPAGAVGLADFFSGVYPRRSPGGWQLIGHTAAPLWDQDRQPPALLTPGTPVRFVAVREQIAVTPPPPAEPHRGPGLEILRPGILCTVQDLGRTGQADMGVPGSGAADRSAAIRANRRLGNADGAAVLELTLGGFRARAHEVALLLAVAGAPARVTVHTADDPDGTPVGDVITLRPGAEIRIARPSTGLRTYLAVKGGIDVPPVLGSRSTDQLSGLGPPPVQRGDVLPIGAADDGPAPVPAGHRPPAADLSAPAVLEVIPGPHLERFDGGALDQLIGQEYTVTPRSNRVGLRLDAPAPLQWARQEELPSEGMVTGSLQVPWDGLPVLFLADHPVTGGYPVIGVLTDASVDRAAQLVPGETLRFALAPDRPVRPGA
ncbi:5-oxoprolinase/urea amidolyase family protein [Nakamurella sp. YIM 132087]|uniref:5-oxoprolinase/urea amidolyase family protein n=1 Tax=Nakamurella alba TaxID=2665158 RepID=A0A7K1FSP8_9ACTN|nr:5-oxoprolinase/urea amidolyase family protein [Nakamurella alba]MTD15864.1 5-oxoprolinase/urea amidolyase family protein [Nakamurella alba]